MRCPCGADWFVEQRTVRPSGQPRNPQHSVMPNQEMPRYRYVCTECGDIYGSPRPEPEPEKAATKPAEPTTPKRRGRPPKSAQTTRR